MNIIIFDTETTSLDKPFAYNIGYVIYDTEAEATITKRDFVIEQVWYNLPLFNSAYYAEKRQLYVGKLRSRTAEIKKYGHAMRTMLADIRKHEVVSGYAYNSSFDERVFAFNSDWYKCTNPIEELPIFDIRGYVHREIAFTQEYQEFCDEHELYTATGHYSTTAEAVFKFILNDPNFIEEHTALADSEIELEILLHCIEEGGRYDSEDQMLVTRTDFNQTYKTYASITRDLNRSLEIIDADTKEVLFNESYQKITIDRNRTLIRLRRGNRK